MAWHRPGDKPLSEPMMAYLNDAYMRHSASMNKYWSYFEKCSQSPDKSHILTNYGLSWWMPHCEVIGTVFDVRTTTSFTRFELWAPNRCKIGSCIRTLECVSSSWRQGGTYTNPPLIQVRICHRANIWTSSDLFVKWTSRCKLRRNFNHSARIFHRLNLRKNLISRQWHLNNFSKKHWILMYHQISLKLWRPKVTWLTHDGTRKQYHWAQYAWFFPTKFI